LGNYVAALPLCQHALDIYRRAFGEDDPYFAGTLANLATFHRLLHNYAAAQSLTRQSVDVWQALVGEDHEDFAAAAFNLGVVHHEMGDYANAELRYSQARQAYRNALGDVHPDLVPPLVRAGKSVRCHRARRASTAAAARGHHGRGSNDRAGVLLQLRAAADGFPPENPENAG
jgi:tetratricopeptide (TPR) repeat protein